MPDFFNWLTNLRNQFSNAVGATDPNFSVAQDRWSHTPVIYTKPSILNTVMGARGIYDPLLTPGAFDSQIQRNYGVSDMNLPEKPGMILLPTKGPEEFRDEWNNPNAMPSEGDRITLRHEALHALTFGHLDDPTSTIYKNIRDMIPQATKTQFDTRYPVTSKPFEVVEEFPLFMTETTNPFYYPTKRRMIAQFPNEVGEKINRMMKVHHPNLYQGVKPGPYVTNLKPDEEKMFRQWVKDFSFGSPALRNFNPNDPTSDYDLRGYWQAQRAGDPRAKADPQNQHLPDIWKTPYHNSFSSDSMYATPEAPHWVNNTLVNKSGEVVFREGDPDGGNPAEHYVPGGRRRKRARRR